jgi:hypothetical protein
MTKKKRGNVNRLLDPRWVNHTGEWQLWDRDGRLWRLDAEELMREEAEPHYFDPAVPVAVAEGAAGLSWVEPEFRQREWLELRKRAFDPSWRPPRAAPGALPFKVMRFVSEDQVLLLFHDHD